MLSVFRASASGMSTNQTQLDVISNNLANINTPGFKASRVQFSELLYHRITPPGEYGTLPTMSPLTLSASTWVGAGVRSESTQQVFTNGSLQRTDNPLDVAIQGDGFFIVELDEDLVGYSRDGSFTVDAEGVLRTKSGYRVLPEVVVPAGVTDIQIDEAGIVYAEIGDPATTIQIGELQLARFTNPNGLLPVGDNLLLATVASGQAEVGYPASEGFGQTLGGNLEMSNVDIADQMTTMIMAQRAYSLSARSLQTLDEMLGMANNLRR